MVRASRHMESIERMRTPSSLSQQAAAEPLRGAHHSNTTSIPPLSIDPERGCGTRVWLEVC